MTPMEEIMKKTERIQHELFFLNEHKNFNLIDLMETFHISKSTALRDILELERLGVPIYAENGRYGGYKIIHHSPLPPIYFNEKEIFALFFSLQILKLVTESPFGDSHTMIQKKLLHTFGVEKQDRIEQVLNCVQYEGVYQIESTKNLEQLFSSIIKNEIIKISYTRYERTVKRILPTHLTLREGYWYCIALDMDKKQWRTYRCDYIETIEIEISYQTVISAKELEDMFENQQKTHRNIPFKAKVSILGKEHFLKNQFANMSLEVVEDDYFIVGKFHQNELDFLTNYFLGFGEHVEIVEPQQLKLAYVDTLRKILTKYQATS